MTAEVITERAARLLSIVSHPMLVPIYTIVYLLYFTDTVWSLLTSMEDKRVILLYTSMGTTLMPLIWLGICLLLKLVKDIEMPSRAERFWPLLLSCVTCGVTGLLACVLPLDLPHPVVGMVWGEFLLLLLALVITHFSKISLHCLGMGAMLAFVIMVGRSSQTDFGPGLYAVIAMTGLVAWARLRLRAHSPAQLVCGLAVGFVCMQITLLEL